MNNRVRGWIDWNLLLDFSGGPNHVNNLCSAPILAEQEKDKLFFENSYYYIGHFSRYVQPGAYRIPAVGSDEKLRASPFFLPIELFALCLFFYFDNTSSLMY